MSISPPSRLLPLLLLTAAIAPGAAETLNLTGNLLSIRQVDVRARVGGMLQEVRFREGMRFRKGDVLAILEPDLFQLDVAQAEADLEAAKARLAAMEAGGRPEERAVAEARRKAAASTLELAHQELQRTEKLHTAGGATVQSLDRAREQWEAAKAQLKAAEETLDLVREGPRSEEKRAARAAVQSAEVHLQRAQLNLGYTQVKAPFDGLIGRRLVDPGEYVLAASSPQSPVLCVFSDTSKIKAIFDIPERKMLYVRLGQEVRVRVQAADHVFLGKVSNLYPFVDPATRLGKLEVEIPNDPIRLVPGMFARGELDESEKPATSAEEILRGE